MYQPVTLFISVRYMHGCSTDRFIRFISYFSTISIMIGVMALVIILSVMNGFEKELQNNVLKLMPQAFLSSSAGFINPQKLPENKLKLKGVNQITPITIGDVVLQSKYNFSAGIMIGIDPVKNDPLTPYIINAKQTELKSRKYNVILGKHLARQLNVNIGDQLRVMVPSISRLTPIGILPTQRLFNVIGTFASNSEVDSYQILVNIQDASRLMHYPQGNITGWRLWLNNPLKIEEVSRQKIPEGIKWQDWRDRKGDLFQAIRMEKNMMVFLSGLILIIALFNVVASLCLRVVDRQKEIAILQIQGFTSNQIITVFMIQGTSTSIIGTLLGVLLGIMFTSKLGSTISIISKLLGVESLPVAIDSLQIISIMLVTVIVSLISTIYPAWHASITKPARILYYE